MPGVLLAVMLIAVFLVIGGALQFFGAVALLGKRPIPELLGTCLVSLAVMGTSGWLLYAQEKRKLGSTAPVSLYLLGMVLIHPLCNVLRTRGLYVPGPGLSDPSRPGGPGIYELGRYAVLLGLVFWVASSRALKAYLASDRQDAR